MNRCTSCSAPLKVNLFYCAYCGIRNALDLHGKSFSSADNAVHRSCPDCSTSLSSIELKAEKGIKVEQCKDCFGIFFDKDELEHYLEKSTSNVYSVNNEQIKNVAKDRYKRQDDFTYRKCPECEVLMHRKNFGYKSGVVVDVCAKHGVWLDNGELTHLLEWHKAGGKLLHQQKSDANAKAKTAEARKQRPETRFVQTYQKHNNYHDAPDFIEFVGDAIAALFKL